MDRVQIGWGVVKISKKSKVSVGKSLKSGGVFGNQKSPKVQRVPMTIKIITHFHLMRTHKHKMLSIVVLNMAKYTIISLILIDFVPIFFIFNLFRNFFRGSFRVKKIPSSKKSQVDLRGGGQPISIKSQVQKSPNPARGRGGGSSPLGTNSQVSLLF